MYNQVTRTQEQRCQVAAQQHDKASPTGMWAAAKWPAIRATQLHPTVPRLSTTPADMVTRADNCCAKPPARATTMQEEKTKCTWAQWPQATSPTGAWEAGPWHAACTRPPTAVPHGWRRTRGEVWRRSAPCRRLAGRLRSSTANSAVKVGNMA
jgi:hypothetical protein